MYPRFVDTLFQRFADYLEDRRGELDEKALLIAFFVLVALTGLSPLGAAVSNMFKSLASQL